MNIESLKVLRDSYNKIVSNIKNKFSIDISEPKTYENGILLKDISDRVSKRFIGTRVDVYTIDCNEPNAFTMPFMEITTTPFFQKIGKWFLIGPLFIAIFGSLEGMIRSNMQLIKHGQEPIQFDPKNKTANIHIPHVKCFVSNKLLEILNDNEIDAIIMHEVGHNAPVMQLAFLYSLQTTTYGGWFITLIKSFANKTQDDVLHSQLLLMFFMFLMLLISILNYYHGKKFEIYADTFAVNMGYAKPLMNALMKMRKWGNNYIDEFIKKQNMNKEQEEKFRETLAQIRKNDVHMQDQERQDFLKDKNNSYMSNVKNKNPIMQNSYAMR